MISLPASRILHKAFQRNLLVAGSIPEILCVLFLYCIPIGRPLMLLDFKRDSKGFPLRSSPCVSPSKFSRVKRFSVDITC